jgi:hypothetical protein
MTTALNLPWRVLLVAVFSITLFAQEPEQRPPNPPGQRPHLRTPGGPQQPFPASGQPMRNSPQTLPALDKLTVSAADAGGFVTVTGGPGAVPGGATVFVLSLQSGARAQTTADELGKFSARLVAPNGSTLVINHATGSSGRGWMEAGPALVLTANPRPRGGGQEIRFATAGAGGGSYWMADGVQNNAKYQPGETIEFTIQFTAPRHFC